ncbi:MAG: M48 family metallopeptidase [Proteobacteria bacterium]|nr:M48 family metallopeptidase [Pseudomonadota bacterium]
MKLLRYGSLLCLIICFVISCETVPITGRSQLSLVSSSEINSMSFNQYKDFLSKHKLSNNIEQTQHVKNVGLKISNAVSQFFTMQGQSDRLKDYKWEFNLVEDKEVNAWCMPGGKVVVYTGILPITKDDTGLAVVMGHEIAHAIADHGKERLSQELLTQMGGTALSVALSQQPGAVSSLFLGAYGVGTQVGVLLPYSRLHESEADRLGLIFMSMAGYDPNAAVAFWERMAQGKKGGSSPPEFLSTHPADATRINNIKSYVPEAMKYRR